MRLGLVYRSDAPDAASASDFEQIGIRTVIDLRAPGEAPARDDLDGIAYVAWPMPPTMEERWTQDLAPAPTYTAVASRYVEMLKASGQQLVGLLDVIADGVPVLLHCSFGRDRTGLLVALLLDLVGVSHRDIALEYALSNVEGNPVSVHPGSMLIVLKYVAKVYGGSAGFLTQHGATAEQIRRLTEVLIA